MYERIFVETFVYGAVCCLRVDEKKCVCFCVRVCACVPVCVVTFLRKFCVNLNYTRFFYQLRSEHTCSVRTNRQLSLLVFILEPYLNRDFATSSLLIVVN